MKSRTLKIVKYLNEERMAGYKEIADAIGETERAVRYDIDSINDELSLRKLPLVEKYAKGMLFVPDDLNLMVLGSDQEYIYSQDDRLSVLRLIILFDIKDLNIRKLTEKFQVSRRSVQNDIEIIRRELQELGIKLVYDKKYRLECEPTQLFIIRGRELKKHVEAIERPEQKNAYEKEVTFLVEEMINPVLIKELLTWIDETLDEMNWILTDDSYRWYVARVFLFVWYIVREYELPKGSYGTDNILGNRVRVLEDLLNHEITAENAALLGTFSKYTNKYVDLDVKQDFISVEDMAMYLVEEMKEQLQIDFISDGILIKGLLNHMGPMIERMNAEEQLHDTDNSFIPEEYEYVYDTMREIVTRHEILSRLTEDEMVYMAVFFLGSIRRMQQNTYKNVLLICGYGYGTTAVVKDALISAYQVFVQKSIPAHRVAHFENWDLIDLVITTVDVELPVKKKIVKVNVIFTNEDYVKLDIAGLQKKNSLSNLFSIERKLNFLEEDKKERVMEIIKEELGYREVRMPKKYYTLSDLIKKNYVCVVPSIDDWRQSVKLCTGMLENEGMITKEYCGSIIKGMENQGFYSVTDGKFALLHGSETAGVKKSCISLVVSETPVAFGEKKVNLVFCLASRDKKEHIPAIIRMMRMIQMTDFVSKLSKCRNSEEVMEIIVCCEKEVEHCYQ